MTVTNAVVRDPSELTTEWLTDVLGAGAVTAFGVERIGTGQMSECYRVALTYAEPAGGPASVILKVAAADPNSRQTGMAMGLYEREVRFYSDTAPQIPDAPVAHCYDAGFDGGAGSFHLLLGDATPATVDILGHAPVQLISTDGRESHFPRVWGTLRTTDGRTGAGWLEWNRNQ